jgi:hypothetical protein
MRGTHDGISLLVQSLVLAREMHSMAPSQDCGLRTLKIALFLEIEPVHLKRGAKSSARKRPMNSPKQATQEWKATLAQERRQAAVYLATRVPQRAFQRSVTVFLKGSTS